MHCPLKNISKVRIGYQLRGRLEHDPNGTHRIIQMRDIGANGTVSSGGLSSFTPRRDSDRYLVGADDILFLARGNRNRAYLPENLGDATVASSHFFIITPETGQIRPAYLAWYLNSRPAQAYLQASAQGTTVMLVQRAVFEEIEIEVPPLDVQARVVAVSSLRDTQRTLVQQLEMKQDLLTEAACLGAIHDTERKERVHG